MKKTKILALLALAAACTPAASARTTMTVYAGSAEDAYVLSDNTSLSFSDDKASLTVDPASGQPKSYSLARIDYISFVTEGAGVEDVALSAPEIALRQNPVEYALEFTAAPAQPCTLSIYSLQGSLMLSRPHWQGESIDAASLPTGLYILQFNNSTIKFYKK